LKDALAPPRSFYQRFELVEGTSPRGLPCQCTDKAGNIYSVPVYIFRVVLLLLRQRRGAAGRSLRITIKYLRRTPSGAAGSGLGTAIKYLRQTTSGAAGTGLGTTVKYLRRTTSGAVGTGLGTTIKYLRRTTRGAAGNGLSRHRGLLMCPFTTTAPHSPCFFRAIFTNKHNSTTEIRVKAPSVCV
jgi:hypothetical protein